MDFGSAYVTIGDMPGDCNTVAVMSERGKDPKAIGGWLCIAAHVLLVAPR